ncbi:MAG TPA: Nramp family divalent metal transporter [Candidatus Saccharimonadales bacterium]|jgi:manganese transport protein|nr:Nramp family divalent metal transporter [Candidatus Saccharimonadales bacterium]
MSSPSDPIASATNRIRFKTLPALQRGEMWRYFGPAFVASVAYIDPGNFAANIEGGSRFGYTLLWVLLWSNAMAILIQYLSAKLGIATGKTLPQNVRAHFSPPVNFLLWIAAEISALATDLAEFLGAAIGMYLLFHLNLFVAALITAVLVFLMLAVELYGFRRLEQLIMALVFAIAGCYAIEIFLVKPDWARVTRGVLVPHLSSASVYIAVSMLGATVMPHVVYLHSALVQARAQEDSFLCPTSQLFQKFKHLKYELIDVLAAMNGAWLINSAMIIMAAAAFFKGGLEVTSIEQAHFTLKPLLGSLSATAFALALLFSGLSSSTVGTMAGQVIIEGFLDIKFPVFLRRLITILPALLVIGIDLDPLRILLLSQVVLSFTLPFALVPLIQLTRRAAVMGDLVNSRRTNALAYVVTGIIISLNLLLLYGQFGGKF